MDARTKRNLTRIDNGPNSEREPIDHKNMPSMEEMDAAGVYGLIFDADLLPESARHYPLSMLRYFYRIGDVSGFRIINAEKPRGAGDGEAI
jgi:hypothetical protein